MPDAASPTTACPACGSPLPAQSGGVCLRCVGQQALRFAGDSVADASVVSPGPSAPAAGPDAPPRQLGPYEIVEEIGRGGMGVVYAARHAGLGRIVALKMITGGRFATAEQEQRFVREAQTAAQLTHPNIVAVHDAGRTGGVAFYTMDLFAEGDLAQRLRTRPPSHRASARLLRRIADAVAYAHARGVLHRDLKPSNILLAGDDPRVADFGLAAQLDPGGELTAATRVLGTPAYLAPEVLAGGNKSASTRSDLYALGAIFYEMLTGRPPFHGERSPNADVEPVAPHLLAPGVPRDLETICLKCLERSPAARYPSVAVLAAELARFEEGRPIEARPLSAPGRFSRWCRRRPALAGVWFLTVAIAGGAVLAAVALARARDRVVAAEHAVREQLRASKLAEAGALGFTRRAGRRAEALAAVRAAAEIRPGRDARDAALAALALHDLQLEQRWTIHAPTPLDAIFAPDGGSYAVGVPDGFAWRETGTDRELGRMSAPEGATSIGWQAFSHDGRRYAARFTDHVVRVWERGGDSVRLLRELPGRPHPWPRPRQVYGRDLEFTADGTRLAVAHPAGGFSLVDLTSGLEVGRVSDLFPSTRIVLSPDGRTLAATSARKDAKQKLRLIDVVSLDVRQTLELGGNALEVEWSADGAYLAASTDAPGLRVFRADTGAVVSDLPAPETNIARVVFAGDDQMLLTGAAEQAFRWRWRRSGEELLRVEGVEMSRIGLTADGREILTTDQVGAGLRFRVVAPTGHWARPVDADAYATSTACGGSLAFSPDGRWLAATAAGEFAIFRAEDLSRAALVPTGDTAGEDVTVAFTAANDAVLACGLRSGLRRHALHVTGNRVEVGAAETLLAGEGWQLRDVSADSARLALLNQQGGQARTVAWDGRTATTLATWAVPGAYAAAFGPGGKVLAINVDHSAPGAADTKLRLWNAADGAELAVLDAPISAEVDWDERSGVALTSNGERLSVLWRAGADGRWQRAAALSAEVPQGNMTTFAIAPGGQWFAVCDASGVRVVRAADGAVLATLRSELPVGFTVDCAISPAGDRVALIDVSGTLRLWHLPALRAELGKLGLDW